MLSGDRRDIGMAKKKAKKAKKAATKKLTERINLRVTEKEYAGLQSGQAVSLVTDAYPGRSFSGIIERIAPVFREASRQARIEIGVENTGQRLKPGMFVRATVVLARLDEATVIPFQALTRRDDRNGIFVLDAERKSVVWREVQPGIRQGDRVLPRAVAPALVEAEVFLRRVLGVVKEVVGAAGELYECVVNR